jgi:hypothetical protein
MNTQRKAFIVKFGLILLAIELFVIISLSLQELNLKQAYQSLFFYSVLIGVIPVLFSLFIMFSDDSNAQAGQNYVIELENTLFLKNGETHINGTGPFIFGLLILGIAIIIYSFSLSILAPPFWSAIIIPGITVLITLKKNPIKF